MIYTAQYTTEHFDEYIQNDHVSVVFVKASWCGPCQTLTPIIEEVAMERDNELLFTKVDADENRDFIKSLDVRNVPTILFYKKGELLERSIGLKTKAEINSILEKLNQN